jgi:hypothetical protein
VFFVCARVVFARPQCLNLASVPARMSLPGSGWPTMPSAICAHVDERVEVDAGRDAHLLAHEGEVLGADVAGRAGVAREGAAAQAGAGAVEACRRPSAGRHEGIGHGRAARVVQVQPQAQRGPALAHGADHRGMALGWAQPTVSASRRDGRAQAELGHHVEHLRHALHHVAGAMAPSRLQPKAVVTMRA